PWYTAAPLIGSAACHEAYLNASQTWSSTNTSRGRLTTPNTQDGSDDEPGSRLFLFLRAVDPNQVEEGKWESGWRDDLVADLCLTDAEGALVGELGSERETIRCEEREGWVAYSVDA